MYTTAQSPHPSIDSRDRARKVTFTAETPGEEYVLAALARQMNEDGRTRIDLLTQWDEVDPDTETGVPKELLR